jgi:hypothetical protein
MRHRQRLWAGLAILLLLVQGLAWRLASRPALWIPLTPFAYAEQTQSPPVSVQAGAGGRTLTFSLPAAPARRGQLARLLLATKRWRDPHPESFVDPCVYGCNELPEALTGCRLLRNELQQPAIARLGGYYYAGPTAKPSATRPPLLLLALADGRLRGWLAADGVRLDRQDRLQLHLAEQPAGGLELSALPVAPLDHPSRPLAQTDASLARDAASPVICTAFSVPAGYRYYLVSTAQTRRLACDGLASPSIVQPWRKAAEDCRQGMLDACGVYAAPAQQ